MDTINTNTHRLKALFLTALGTELRIGKIVALKWEDIDFEKSALSLSKSLKKVTKISKNENRESVVIEQSPKTESSIRTVPIQKNILKELSIHKKTS
ncbi:tyrosine-type recombinase/integrase [Gottschalkia purinilytica]|uniref:tyrosine-type recombinase/integrase n=1 Tax=Gottschalkia purinilytica TaxID=1503 RepID=UPI0009E1A307